MFRSFGEETDTRYHEKPFSAPVTDHFRHAQQLGRRVVEGGLRLRGDVRRRAADGGLRRVRRVGPHPVLGLRQGLLRL